MSSQNNLYKRISLEFFGQLGGQVYIRFEPFGNVPAVMVQVLPGDVAMMSLLGDPKPEGGNVTAVEADDEPADDDFQQGDSG